MDINQAAIDACAAILEFHDSDQEIGDAGEIQLVYDKAIRLAREAMVEEQHTQDWNASIPAYDESEADAAYAAMRDDVANGSSEHPPLSLGEASDRENQQVVVGYTDTGEIVADNPELGSLFVDSVARANCESRRHTLDAGPTLECLRSALRDDPVAISDLVTKYVECNAVLATHPHVVVHGTGLVRGYGWKVGVMGLINGVLTANGLPRVASMWDDVGPDASYSLAGFCEYKPQEEADGDEPAAAPE